MEATTPHIAPGLPRVEDVTGAVHWMFDVVEAIPRDTDSTILEALRVTCEAALYLVDDATKDPALWLDPAFGANMEALWEELRLFLFGTGLERAEIAVHDLRDQAQRASTQQYGRVLEQVAHTLELQVQKTRAMKESVTDDAKKGQLKFQRAGTRV